jgi:hypothetical protein
MANLQDVFLERSLWRSGGLLFLFSVCKNACSYRKESKMNTIIVRRAVSDADRKWLHELWMREWGGPVMAVRGRLFHVEEMECLIAWKGNRRIGAVAYLVRDREMEIMSLNSLEEGTGAGTALLRTVEEEAEKRAWNEFA